MEQAKSSCLIGLVRPLSRVWAWKNSRGLGGGGDSSKDAHAYRVFTSGNERPFFQETMKSESYCLVIFLIIGNY